MDDAHRIAALEKEITRLGAVVEQIVHGDYSARLARIEARLLAIEERLQERDKMLRAGWTVFVLVTSASIALGALLAKVGLIGVSK